MTNKIRSSGLVLGLAIAVLLLLSAKRTAAHDRHEEPVCLDFSDGGSSVLTLKVIHWSEISPRDADDVNLLKGFINGIEPALGSVTRSGPTTVMANLAGTVAGFFTGIHFTLDFTTGAGTGRIAGELSSHQVTAAVIACP